MWELWAWRGEDELWNMGIYRNISTFKMHFIDCTVHFLVLFLSFFFFLILVLFLSLPPDRVYWEIHKGRYGCLLAIIAIKNADYNIIVLCAQEKIMFTCILQETKRVRRVSFCTTRSPGSPNGSARRFLRRSCSGSSTRLKKITTWWERSGSSSRIASASQKLR